MHNLSPTIAGGGDVGGVGFRSFWVPPATTATMMFTERDKARARARALPISVLDKSFCVKAAAKGKKRVQWGEPFCDVSISMRPEHNHVPVVVCGTMTTTTTPEVTSRTKAKFWTKTFWPLASDG